MTSPPVEGQSPSKVMSFVDVGPVLFCLGEILPNFEHLKNMISTYKKIFCGKKCPKSARFQKKKVSILQIFYDKF
jgi:hypothetical protein